MKNIILGVTGSISSYKAADIASRLGKLGYSVHAVLSKNAQEFITPLTFAVLTKNKCLSHMFPSDTPKAEHIELAKLADMLLVAPASANYIAKAACGIADDMLSSITSAFSGSKKPILLCPAMNTAMYFSPANQRNMEILKSFGFFFVEPKEALLACGDIGKGALADPEAIVKRAEELLG